MKKIYLNIVSAAIVVMGVTGCSSDNLLMTGSKQVKANEVVASVEGQTSTRVAVVETTPKSLVWTSGDQISVFDEAGASGTLELNDDYANQAVGKFGGDLDEGFGTMVSAAYPSSGTSLSGTTLTMAIPSEISLEDAIVIEGSKAFKSPLPMYGKFDDTNIEFKFLTGMLKLVIGNLPAGTDKIIITADKPISGTFTASLSDETPILASTSDAAADKVVTVTFTPLTASGAKIIYIPLAVQDYGSIKVQYATTDGSPTDITTWTDKTVARKMVYTAASGYTIEVDATSPSAVSTAIAGAVGPVEAGFPVTIELTGAIATSSNDKTITVPTKNTADEPIDVNLNFSSVPSEEGGILAIKTDQAESEPTTATNKMAITMPESETGIDLNIDAPTTTVTLQSATAATDNTYTYREVTARTAFNTLVVDDGAKLNNAEIEDGTVQVNDNGILESWSFGAKTNGDQVYIKEDGGIEPLMIPRTDEWGNTIEVPQIANKDGEPYYAHSLKIVKDEADYSIVWFGNAGNGPIPLKTVVVGDGATLQTNYIAMEHIVGEGTSQIKYRFTFMPTFYTNEADYDYGGDDKYYEYNSDMVGVKTVKGITFDQPEIAPEEWYQPILQDSIAKGYKMHEPRLNLDVSDEIDGCTFNYNHVYICQEHTLNCPSIKNCKFVHVEHGMDVLRYDENDIVEVRIPYDSSKASNSITFENCEFSAGTKFIGNFFGNFGFDDEDIHYTGYVNFKNCKRGGTDFTGDSMDFVKEFHAVTGTKIIISFNDTPKYEAVFDSSGGGFVVREYNSGSGE